VAWRENRGRAEPRLFRGKRRQILALYELLSPMDWFPKSPAPSSTFFIWREILLLSAPILPSSRAKPSRSRCHLFGFHPETRNQPYRRQLQIHLSHHCFVNGSSAGAEWSLRVAAHAWSCFSTPNACVCPATIVLCRIWCSLTIFVGLGLPLTKNFLLQRTGKTRLSPCTFFRSSILLDSPG
jgi:hypothetical protein